MRLNSVVCGASVIVVAVAVSCGNARDGSNTNAPVATMRGATIYYRQIRCSPRYRSDAARCTTIEQNNLNGRIYGHAIDAAAAMLGIELSPAERAELESKATEGHALTVNAAERMRALLRGVVRIHQGENAATVQRELATRYNVSDRELSEMLSRYPSVETAEEALAIDFVGTGDKSARDFYRREMLTPKLKNAIAARARGANASPDAAEAQLWDEVIDSIDLEIVDKRYTMPSLIGILNKREEHIDVTPR